MTRDQAISALCAISAKVLEHKGYKVPADCICTEKGESLTDFSFSSQIIDFINNAVDGKIARSREESLARF